MPAPVLELVEDSSGVDLSPSDTDTAEDITDDDDLNVLEPAAGSVSMADTVLADVDMNGKVPDGGLSAAPLGDVDGLVQTGRVITTANDTTHTARLMRAVRMERRSSADSVLSPRLSLRSSVGLVSLTPDASLGSLPGPGLVVGNGGIGDGSSSILQSVGSGLASDVSLPDSSGRGLGRSLLTGPTPTTTGAGPSKETNGIVYRSQYRGVSYDKKKRKWRVQIKVAALGKSGVSVGYFDTEDAAARAYDRAAIGLLGPDNCRSILNFPLGDYDTAAIPKLVGKTREEVKILLKNERAKLPRRRLSNRRRTSKYLGVGSSNRKNQWQARILYHGKVTHLGYYPTEEQAARVYDRVSISLHRENAETNFPLESYKEEMDKGEFAGMTRENLQRALGVKPMDKSSKYRGVSKKKGKWEAKVMLHRKWAYRELFDTEIEAARAYDEAVWSLKPKEAKSYVNFKDSCPPKIEAYLRALENGGSAQVNASNSLAVATAQPEGMVAGVGSLNILPGTNASGQAEALSTLGWLKVQGEQDVLQRFNSAPIPNAIPQIHQPANGILVSRSSHPGVLDSRGSVGATDPKLLRVQSVSRTGKVESYQAPSTAVQTLQHMQCQQQDLSAQQSIQLQMVDQGGMHAHCTDLHGQHLHRRASSGAERVFLGQQDMGVTMSDGTLAPVSEVSAQELCAALVPDRANGPLLVRVGSGTHVIQGVPQQVVPPPQRRLSDTGVYLMVRQDDQVGDLHHQCNSIGNVQNVTNFPRQEVVPIQVNSQLEPSPFAVAASLDAQDNQAASALEGVSWNLENVMLGDVQAPSMPQNSLPLSNLGQVLQSNNPGAVAIDLGGNMNQNMDTVMDTSQMKIDPMLLTVGSGHAGQDVIMTDAHICQDPMSGQQALAPEATQVQYGQVARLDEILAVVDPSDPPFKQVQFGDDRW